MIPLKALPNYDMNNEQQFRDGMLRADDQNVKKGTDILMTGGRGGTRNPRFVLYSPSGDPFYLTVADDGTLTTVALP